MWIHHQLLDWVSSTNQIPHKYIGFLDIIHPSWRVSRIIMTNHISIILKCKAWIAFFPKICSKNILTIRLQWFITPLACLYYNIFMCPAEWNHKTTINKQRKEILFLTELHEFRMNTQKKLFQKRVTAVFWCPLRHYKIQSH